MSCQTDIPIRDIADIVGENFIPKEGGKGKETTLVDPRIRGDVALDRDAKEALCEALSPCIDDALTPLETEIGEVDKKADDAVSAAQSANNAADNAMGEAQAAGEAANSAIEAAQSAQQTALNKAVVRVIATGDKREIVLGNGAKIPFYITDKSVPVEPMYNDEKVVGFGVKGDNVVITMIDGTEHDLTRQEFADWLSKQDTPLATDDELAQAIANGTGDLQNQIDALNQGIDGLQAQIDAFNSDQAMLFVRDGKLVLRNEDNTEHEVPLTSLIPISSDAGNLLEMRENGFYYGIQAPPNLANIFVDAENGNDNQSIEDGGGTKGKPFKTLDKALDLVPSNKSSTVHLKACGSDNQALIYDVNVNRSMREGAIRVIRAYGEQPFIPSEVANCISSKTYNWNPSHSNQFVRPIIRFNWYKAYLKPIVRQYLVRHGGFVDSGFKYQDVHLFFTKAQFDKSEFPLREPYFSSGGFVEFKASILEWEDDSEANIMLLLSNSSVTLSRTKFINTPNRALFDLYQGNLTIQSSPIGGVASSSMLAECDPEGTLSTLEHNATQVLANGSLYKGLARHTTGTPLNVNSNFSF